MLGAASDAVTCQAQPVSSLSWATMAKSLTPGFTIGDQAKFQTAKTALAQLLNTYNNRPDVANSAELATRDRKRKKQAVEDENEDLGIAIGERKARCVENFLANSSETFWKHIEAHLNEHMFSQSAWSEKIWQRNLIWIGSKLSVDLGQVVPIRVQSLEAAVVVDWSLPLNQKAHEALAVRINEDFRRAIALTHNPEKRKSERKDDEKLVATRNVMAFWFHPGIRDVHIAGLSKATFDELEAIQARGA